MNEARRELLAKLASTTDFNEKRDLVIALEKMDREAAARQQEERDVDWFNMKTASRLAPVIAYDRHSTESDWLDELTTTAAADYSNQIHAQASMWYKHLDPEVKADHEEFMEQAKGAAQRIAGRFGDRAEAGEQEFLAYVAFLNREAASGLPQIQQEYNAKDNYAPVPMPTETFDTFVPEVSQAEMGSAGRAPMLSDSAPGGGSGRPSEHDTTDDKLDDAPNENYPQSAQGDGSGRGTPSRHGSLWDGIPDDEEGISAMASSFERFDDAVNFTEGSALQTEAAGRGKDFWDSFKKRIKDNLSGGPGRHKRPKTGPKHRKTEPDTPREPGRHRRDPKSESPGRHRRTNETPPAQRGAPSSEEGQRTPVTINHPKSPGRHRKDHGTPIHDNVSRDRTNPLTDPHHKVKDTGTPIHDRAKEDVATDHHIRRELDKRLRGEEHSVQEIKNPGDRKNMQKKKSSHLFTLSELRPAEAASGLDQIQQVVNVHDEKETTPLPPEVAFPINPGWDDEHPNSQGPGKKEAYLLAAKLMEQASQLIKQADMWGSSDMPHRVPGGDVANSPSTTPESASGTFEEGYLAGVADKAVGEAPTFSDASSGASDYVRGYSKGYSESEFLKKNPKDVPSSLGGDNGQAYNSERIREKKGLPLSMGGSLRVSAAFTQPEALDNPDFRKGYVYARKWTEGSPLVRQGSAEFEAGVYSGITDNPENQRAFVAANRRHEVLASRLETHRDMTYAIARENDDLLVKGLYIQGATSTDLQTTAPGTSPDPMGSTPVMGPGTIPPHAGMDDPARPAGPPPYNGAPPFGAGPVVPDPVVGPEQEDPRVRENPKLAAFVARVQENLKGNR